MMWIVFARAPAPDAAYWPGRRWLGAIDAIAWPLAAMALLAQVSGGSGILMPTGVAVLALVGLSRVHTAFCLNHRYRFTTWRWGRIAQLLLVVGALIKLLLTMR
jgi:hypothetical protein